MSTVLAISLSRVNQLIPFHVFQFSDHELMLKTKASIWRETDQTILRPDNLMLKKSWGIPVFGAFFLSNLTQKAI